MEQLFARVYNAYKTISDELDSIMARDPAAVGKTEVALLYSGFHAVIAHRAAHYLHKNGLIIPARIVSQGAKMLTGIEIHPGATIGKGLFIDHGSGVVIGETAEIGDNCTLYQGVTLGGTGKDVGKRHPTLGNNVMVGCGAKILGPIRVGDNCKIAANAVVLSSIPENCTAVGIPARIVKKNNVRIDPNADLDQIHIPDPVSQELCVLRMKVSQLEEKLAAMMKEEH
ncbi:MAG: serine O-acetyltransferase [Firmicutes bacterium]|nr:serine O-acetyltransferase [Candidatus Colimorpha enterica]